MDIVEWRPLFTACPRRSEDHWGQNVTIVQNNPIVFRVKEKMLRQALTLPFGQRIIRRIRETAN